MTHTESICKLREQGTTPTFNDSFTIRNTRYDYNEDNLLIRTNLRTKYKEVYNPVKDEYEPIPQDKYNS